MSDEIELEAAVIKRGETCIITELRRNALGLQLRVKTHPAVELFMRGLSDPSGSPLDVTVSDRYWEPQKGQSLLAYRFAQPFIPTGDYTLEALGRPLIEPEDRNSGHINLSFLRLIGISEGAGISFALKGVYSLDALRRMQDRLTYSQQQFYINYIRPVNCSVIVSSQEVQL